MFTIPFFCDCESKLVEMNSSQLVVADTMADMLSYLWLVVLTFYEKWSLLECYIDASMTVVIVFLPLSLVLLKMLK